MFVWTVCMLILIPISSTCSVQDEICTNLTAVQEVIVNMHNDFRRNVVPPASNMLKMNWSEELAASAQEWANTCALAHGPPSSRMIRGYQLGENLFMSTEPDPWTNTINAWHSEVADFKYPLGSTAGQPTGHYTQVVWYGSYEVGCGVADCGSHFFYVCRYYRAGNFKGVPPYAKGKPCSACPQACEDNLCTDPCPYVDKYPNCRSLKQKGTCNNFFVITFCAAQCMCDDEIIPVGKK